jgi:hypothetical protein
MAGEYVEIDVVTEAEELKSISYDRMQVDQPTWDPATRKGSATVRVIDATAYQNAEVMSEFGAVTDIAAARMFALIGIPQLQAVQATTSLTVTVLDSAGYVIPSGTEWLLSSGAGEQIIALSVEDITIPPGSETTVTGGVTVIAVDPGTIGNGYGLGGLGITGAQLQAPIYTWITGATAVAATTGGVDSEDNDTYLSRAARQARRLSYSPLDLEDCQNVALSNPAVGRALVLPLYNADTSTANVAGHVSIVVCAADGTALSSGIKTGLVNNEFANVAGITYHVMDPTYQQIDIEASVGVAAGADPTAVALAVHDALASYIDPSNWGTNGVTGDSSQWSSALTVRYRTLETVAKNASPDVDHVNFVKIALAGGSRTEADVSLTGPAPLTKVSTGYGVTVATT